MSHLLLVYGSSAGLTFLIVDLLLGEKVDTKDDKVGDHIGYANCQQNLRIFERYLFRNLHHPKDNDQVSAAMSSHLAGACQRQRGNAKFLSGCWSFTYI